MMLCEKKEVVHFASEEQLYGCILQLFGKDCSLHIQAVLMKLVVRLHDWKFQDWELSKAGSMLLYPHLNGWTLASFHLLAYHTNEPKCPATLLLSSFWTLQKYTVYNTVGNGYSFLLAWYFVSGAGTRISKTQFLKMQSHTAEAEWLEQHWNF